MTRHLSFIHSPRVLLLASLFAWGCTSSAAEQSPLPSVPPKSTTHETVQTSTVRLADSTHLGSWFAEIKLVSGSTRRVSPPIEGKLTKWLVTAGQKVEPGTPLATFLSEDLADLDLAYQEVRQQIALKEKLLKSREKQLQSGVATRMELDELRTSLDMERARARTIQGQRSVRLSSLRRTRDHQLVWESSTAGEVVALSCAEGERVLAGSDCLTLINREQPEVIVYIPQKDLKHFAQVTRARFVADSGLDTFSPTLSRHEPVLDEGHRMIRSHWSIPEQALSSPTLLSNMTGRLEISGEAKAHVLRLPRLALTQLDGKDVVFKQTEQGWRPAHVDVSREVDDDVLAQSDDLDVGDHIASQGVFTIKGRHLMGEQQGAQ